MEEHAIFFFQKIHIAALAGKLLLAVFWDSQGSHLEHYMQRRTTVKSVNYCKMLRNKLRPAICTNQRGCLSQGVVLLHDKAPPQGHISSSTPTKNWIGKFLSTLHTAQTWPLPISIRLVVNLKMMMRWKKRCMSDFVTNENHSFFFLPQLH
jgi:hypothetical protein